MTIADNPLTMPADSQEKIDTPLTREVLYALVWSEPMIKVAAKFDVSSSYMARVCTRMNVPRPERGYWAKFAVGKIQMQIPLPEAQPGNELVWSRDGNSVQVLRPLPKPPVRVNRILLTQGPIGKSNGKKRQLLVNLALKLREL